MARTTALQVIGQSEVQTVQFVIISQLSESIFGCACGWRGHFHDVGAKGIPVFFNCQWSIFFQVSLALMAFIINGPFCLQGTWVQESSRAMWKFPELGLSSPGSGVGSIRARFQLKDGPGYQVEHLSKLLWSYNMLYLCLPGHDSGPVQLWGNHPFWSWIWAFRLWLQGQLSKEKIRFRLVKFKPLSSD